MSVEAEVRAGHWEQCGGCGSTVYGPRLERAQRVCPDCGHHHRVGAADRLRLLVDPASFAPLVYRAGPDDPLDFAGYRDQLARARRRTGREDAACVGRAAIGGRPVIVAAMDFTFMGGSMGTAVGEAVTAAAEEALSSRVPLVVVAASGGARMQEGALSLMQLAKTARAMRRLRKAGVLSVCVLTDPTFGGVTASFATLADVLVAERGARIGFAGPRVIAAATREALPEGFQSAADLSARGLVDRVESREAIRPLLARLLALLDPVPPEPAPPDAALPVPAPGAPAGAGDPWETLRLARDIARPTALDHIHRICDDFVELHGDRAYGDDPAVVGGIGSLGGTGVMLIGHQKGHDTAELVARNFGMPQPEGYRKAARLMALADRLGLPVVTFVDTQGAAPGVGAEQRGQAWAVAESIAVMSELGVPVVAAVTGEGGSGGALALAVANRVLMLENACYSVISPESCSTILYGDPSRGPEMAAALRVGAAELVRLGVADAIVPEPPGGAQADGAEASARLGAAVRAALAELRGWTPDELRRQRHDRFRRLGAAS
ncbi:acetyl-CoA carboxylase carboxyltransferase subunit alpha [Nonomuraea sp. NPDC050451]|uniref:acetyl-CoA carboxylase carboxyltransferase subunit alpha n=1 Tax=Nonomuraea sp. NPDC050451 TaxID=3364364 RepID=UPI0037B0CEAC